MRYFAPAFFVALVLATALVPARPTLAAPEPVAKTLTADADHTCIVSAGGGARCWGDNGDGKLGDGTTAPRAIPVPVSGLSGVSAIAGGLFHTCAITTGGALWCWGDNTYGQLGDGTTDGHLTPNPVPGLGSGVTDVGAGYSHTCAVVSGGVKCWGDNVFGQLGNGSTTDHPSPIDVFGLTSGVVAVAVGQYFNCALTTGGGVKCWGDNAYGQLGDGTETQREQPVDVVGLTSGVRSIAASEGGHTCALLETGAVKCWGNNEYGQLGENRACPTPCTAPVDVTGLSSGVSEITVAYFTSCALMSGGVKCWGNNQFGQIGDDQLCGVLCGTPQDVSGLSSGVTMIAGGARHVCAETASTLYCWGDNFEGQLGDNGACGTFCLVPVVVAGAADFPVGDANCDHATNSIDSAVILQFGAGLVPSLACAAQADVNGDGTVNSIDSALILQFEAGLITTLPP